MGDPLSTPHHVGIGLVCLGAASLSGLSETRASRAPDRPLASLACAALAHGCVPPQATVSPALRGAPPARHLPVRAARVFWLVPRSSSFLHPHIFLALLAR